MRYYIVTGTSRGIGEGIARALLNDTSVVFSIARNGNAGLEEASREAGSRLEYIECDLSHTESLENMLDNIFSKIDLSSAEGVYLVNNAGVLTPVGPAETNGLEETEHHLRVNLLAPMRLTAGFIARTAGFSGRRVVAHVSSGAAKHPYFGWSCYCTGKAGLEMFTRVVGAEQESAGNPVIVYTIDPGIVDTFMQAQIRALDDGQFRDKSKFVRYQEMGYLADRLETGRKIAGTLDDPEISTGDSISVRDR